MRKKHRSLLAFVLRGMVFSDRVSKGKIKPSAIDCIGWGRINAINFWLK